MIRRVAAGIGMTTFDKLVVAGTQLALVPILATGWGLDLYGQWLLLATVPQFLSMSDLGFATAAGTRMTMAVARGDRQTAVCIFQSGWRAILGTSAVLICLLSAIIWFVPASTLAGASNTAPESIRLTLWILALYGVLAVQGSILFAGFRAAGFFPFGAFCNAIVLLVESAALVGTVLLGGGIVAAASAWLAGRALGLSCQVLALRRKVPWLSIGLRLGNWSRAREMLAPAGAVMLLPATQALLLQGSALVVGAAAGPASVPIFAATRTLSRIGMQMCWIVSTPLMPEFSAAVARGDRKGMAVMVLMVLLFSAAFVLPYAIVFMAFGQSAVTIWTGGAILPPVSLVLAMGMTILFGGVWYPLSNLVLARDRQASYSVWYAALALIGLPSAYWLTGMYGVSGAACAMAVLDMAMLLVIARLFSSTLCGPGELVAAMPLVRERLHMLARRFSPVAKG